MNSIKEGIVEYKREFWFTLKKSALSRTDLTQTTYLHMTESERVS